MWSHPVVLTTVSMSTMPTRNCTESDQGSSGGALSSNSTARPMLKANVARGTSWPAKLCA
jgi:hypothetical protein